MMSRTSRGINLKLNTSYFSNIRPDEDWIRDPNPPNRELVLEHNLKVKGNWDYSLEGEDGDEAAEKINDLGFESQFNYYNLFGNCAHKLEKVRCPCPLKNIYTICMICKTLFCSKECLSFTPNKTTENEPSSPTQLFSKNIAVAENEVNSLNHHKTLTNTTTNIPDRVARPLKVSYLLNTADDEEESKKIVPEKSYQRVERNPSVVENFEPIKNNNTKEKPYYLSEEGLFGSVNTPNKTSSTKKDARAGSEKLLTLNINIGTCSQVYGDDYMNLPTPRSSENSVMTNNNHKKLKSHLSNSNSNFNATPQLSPNIFKSNSNITTTANSTTLIENSNIHVKATPKVQNSCSNIETIQNSSPQIHNLNANTNTLSNPSQQMHASSNYSNINAPQNLSRQISPFINNTTSNAIINSRKSNDVFEFPERVKRISICDTEKSLTVGGIYRKNSNIDQNYLINMIPSIQIGKTFDAQLTYVTHPWSLGVVPLDKLELYKKCKKFQYNPSWRFINYFKIGMNCLANFSPEGYPEVWMRGRVVGIVTSPNKLILSVYGIDNGMITDIERKRVREMPSNDPNVPLFPGTAFILRLINIKTKGKLDEGLREKLTELIDYKTDGKIIRVLIRDNSPHINENMTEFYNGNASFDGVDLADALVESGLVEYIRPPAQNESRNLAEIAKEKEVEIAENFLPVDSNSTIKIKISHINDLNEFYVVREESLGELAKLNESLQNCVSFGMDPYDSQLHSHLKFLCARSTSSGWSRCKVVGIENDKIRVKFIDSGERSEFSKLDVRVLPSWADEPPQLASRCSLPICPSKIICGDVEEQRDGKWSSTALKQLSNLGVYNHSHEIERGGGVEVKVLANEIGADGDKVNMVRIKSCSSANYWCYDLVRNKCAIWKKGFEEVEKETK